MDAFRLLGLDGDHIDFLLVDSVREDLGEALEAIVDVIRCGFAPPRDEACVRASAGG